MAAKDPSVGGDTNFRFRMLLKGTVSVLEYINDFNYNNKQKKKKEEREIYNTMFMPRLNNLKNIKNGKL